MSGGTVRHSLICANVSGTLRSLIKGGPCRVFDSNLRVRIRRRGLYSYPDVTVICGKAAFDEDDSSGESVINAQLVVEVLSPSTESFDRKQKFDQYRDIPSFQEYVLVSQETARVESYARQPDGSWSFDVANELSAKILLRSIQVELPLAEVYSGVDFTQNESPTA